MVKTASTRKEKKMKLRILAAGVLLAAIGLISTAPVFSQPNRTRNSYAPGFWQPRGQIDRSRPIAVMLLNDSGLPVSYSLTPNPDRTLSPGSTVQITIPSGNEVRDIASINIYASKELVYEYNSNPRENKVMVRIRQSDSRFRADKAVYIDEVGRVYAF